ncbi:MAG: serine hydrolase domain-containing protein [bacterium]|nr:serine hydrolase domain-containing protein [bacterium]
MNNEKLKKSLKFIDSFLDLRYRRNDWPGFAVAISHKGNVVFDKAYGYANLERKEKLTVNHIFRIASHSKTFTATAIMQLFEQKKLKLSDYVVQYLSWLNEHGDKRFRKITIKQLLSHGAGIIRDGLDSGFWILAKPFPNKEQLIKAVLTSNLVLNSNTQMKYSNIGYSLLGLIIEQVSGVSYNDYVLKNIINPLGLENTGPEIDSRIENRIVTGYSRKDNNIIRIPIANINTKTMSPATGFYSTSEDICKYFNAQMVGSGKLLSDDSKKIIQKVEWKIKNNWAKEKYGLGFIISIVEKHELFGHTGGFPGQITATLCDPKEDLIVTVFTNCIDGLSSSTAKGIISTIYYFDKNYHLNSKQNLSKFEGRFMNLWGIADMVSMGNKVIAVYPDVFRPFDNPEELKYINTNTLKITKTDGFYAEGELVHYNYDKQSQVKSLTYTGSTMLPEKEYLSKKERLISGIH